MSIRDLSALGVTSRLPLQFAPGYIDRVRKTRPYGWNKFWTSYALREHLGVLKGHVSREVC